MNIVRIVGGLGNQMFQYAFYRALKEKNTDTVGLDLTPFQWYNLHNGYELDRLFGINEGSVEQKYIDSMRDEKKDIINKVRRKLLGRKKSHYRETKIAFNEEVFKLRNTFFDGYWQSEKYFKEIENIIREEFTFKIPLDEKNFALVEEIKNCNSVSLHVRRGDYITNKEVNKLYGNVCTLDYYRKAIEYINSRVENPKFYVFSNDLKWVKENLDIPNAVYIDWNTKEDSYKDMQLMSCCRHNIVANSSFSWWGAWLNTNKDKIVVSPDRWFNDEQVGTNDIIPEEWIKIK